MSLITDSSYWVAPKPRSIPLFELPWLNKRNFLRYFIPNALKISRILKEIDPDLVHLHVQHWYSPVIIIGDFPFILTSWGDEVLLLKRINFLETGLAKISATKAGMITVDAECMKEKWRELGIPEYKIKVIPFGVDVDIFNPSVDAHALRKNLRIGENDIVVISTRALYNNHYNVECLIRAIPLILKSHRDAKFLIKGTGPLEGYLKSLVAKLNVSENVRFVGLVPYNEVARYLAASDIYVATSFIDSTSVSLLEAMACGLPPVVTDIPGNREWIENRVNGFLYTPKNHLQLADLIIQLIENKPLRKRFGDRCSEIIKQKATWKKCVAEMDNIYKSFLEQKKT
jgi:glycosyltransferase involved in cell wall biosynthesis